MMKNVFAAKKHSLHMFDDYNKIFKTGDREPCFA